MGSGTWFLQEAKQSLVGAQQAGLVGNSGGTQTQIQLLREGAADAENDVQDDLGPLSPYEHIVDLTQVVKESVEMVDELSRALSVDLTKSGLRSAVRALRDWLDVLGQVAIVVGKGPTSDGYPSAITTQRSNVVETRAAFSAYTLKLSGALDLLEKHATSP